jgi:CBS domain-containing protein
VHSAIIDTVVRRAITLVFERRAELPVDAFTWLSLGSNGRHEVVLSSDVDSAASFVDTLNPDEITTYRAAFADVADILDGARLYRDERETLGAETRCSPGRMRNGGPPPLTGWPLWTATTARS